MKAFFLILRIVQGFAIFIVFGVNALIVLLAICHFVNRIEVFVEDLVLADVFSDFVEDLKNGFYVMPHWRRGYCALKGHQDPAVVVRVVAGRLYVCKAFSLCQ